MNRIILIGNGFDVAHCLETSYKSFIDNYWSNFIKQAYSGRKNYHEDNFMKFSTNSQTLAHILSSTNLPSSCDELSSQIKSYKEQNMLGDRAKIDFIFKNKFMEHILKKLGLEKWVDIENEYYEKIKRIAENHDSLSTTEYDIKSLNQDFKAIEMILEAYLTKQENSYQVNNSIVEEISKKIMSPFNIEDISHKHTDSFFDEIKHKIEKFNSTANQTDHIDRIDRILNVYRNKFPFINFDSSDTINFNMDYISLDKEDFYLERLMVEKAIPNCFMLPDNILFLNFNYTHITDIYNKESYFKTIHIHGELNNNQNSIIFGYGDELADDYKTIENLNDNNYLTNVKSTRYLETSNYRDLISFIESSPYQIFTMGHSCGNSDRTLLNTLFEHDNCISIKPYYHQMSENKDNYNDIVQNISRNFVNKSLMRDRVVNKTYCNPLLELNEKIKNEKYHNKGSSIIRHRTIATERN